MKKLLILALSALCLLCLFTGCGGSEPETPTDVDTPATEVSAAGTAEITWESYLNWLADTFGSNSPDPDAYRELLFQAQSWEDIDVTVGPWDKLFGEDSFNASTWDEYVAAGGIGTYNESYEDDALTGSGEPSGEASGEPVA